jgi:hypothetical protein
MATTESIREAADLHPSERSYRSASKIVSRRCSPSASRGGARQPAASPRHETLNVPGSVTRAPAGRLIDAVPSVGAGFVLDGLEEPAFGPGDVGNAPAPSWLTYHDIPPVLVTRARRPG